MPVCACVGMCIFFSKCVHIKKMCFPGRIFVHGTMSGTVLGGNGEMIHFTDLCSARSSMEYFDEVNVSYMFLARVCAILLCL